MVMLRHRDEEFQQLQKRILQLSLSNNKTSRNLEPVMNTGIDVWNFSNFRELSYKLKPDIFKSSAPLQEFLVQFELILFANKWDNFSKTVALASSLRVKVCSVFDVTEP